MSNFGVVPTGFSRKPLTTILSELEQSNIDRFGPGVIQTSQSPLGTWNGLRADFAAALWELAEAVYQSIDPDQAEGARLDMLANLRLITRRADESDEGLRQAITNAGQANVRDAEFLRALYSLDGVTWAKVYSNDTNTVDEHGLDPHSVAAAVMGGDDEEVARTVRLYTVPGIGTSGNLSVSTEVDGLCRTMRIVRPIERPAGLWLTVNRQSSGNGCPPPSIADLEQAIAVALSGDNRLANGEALTMHKLRTIVSCAYPGVEIIEAMASFLPDSLSPLPLTPSFFEMATFELRNIEVLNND